MPYQFTCFFYKIIILFIYCNIMSACSSKKKESQIIQLLQQSDSALWQSKSQAKAYAQQAFDEAVKIKDRSLQSRSLQRLANSVRVTTNLAVLLSYDSAAVTTARLAKDTIALFEGLNSWARDLLSINSIAKANVLIMEEQAISNQLIDGIYKAKYLYTVGLASFKSSKHEAAKENFKASLQIAEKKGNQYLAALNKVKIFSADQYLGIHDTTGKIAFEAVEYFKNNNYPEDEASAWFAVGENYRYIGNIKKAQEYYYKAIELITKQENYLLAGIFQNTIFATMLSAGKLPEAKDAVKAMEKYFSRIDYTIGKILVENYWGQYYIATGEFDKAEKALLWADSISDATGFSALKAVNAMHRAVLLDKQHKAKESDSVMLLSLGAASKMLSPKLIENGYKDKNGKSSTNPEKKLFLDRAYLKDSGAAYLNTLRAQNDSNESPIYQPLLSVFDSSTAMSFNRQIADLETQYKTRIFRDSLKLQQQQTIIAEEKGKTKNIVIASTLVLLLLVATGLFLEYRNRKRAEKDKAKIQLLQNEIHHRVKNNLAVINRLVEVAGKNSVEDAPLVTLKNRIKSIELLHNHLYSNEAKTGNISLQSYFEDLCLAIAATFQTTKDIEINVKAPTEVDSTIAEKLGLILNELVTNSFKYAFENREAGNITVTAKPEGKQLNITVQDNGIGMQTEKNTKSYGMKLIKGLSNELNGKFTFQNLGGTSFQLSIPLSAA